MLQARVVFWRINQRENYELPSGSRIESGMTQGGGRH